MAVLGQVRSTDVRQNALSKWLLYTVLTLLDMF